MKNYSRQREEIIKVIKESHKHLTAEDIYMIVKAMDPGVSRSTVYRNLGILTENSILEKISMPYGPDRYDYKIEKHNHAICIKCGNVYDFEFEFDFDIIKNKVLKQTGIEILNNGITLEGICDSCKNNK